MFLPDVILLSTQRSGTHLLMSFLNKHPRVNGRGEIFAKYKRTGEMDQNIPEKINVAILMYTQMSIFANMGGDLNNIKVIHLLRNAEDVAKSRLQMEADKKIMGSAYRAHYHKEDKSIDGTITNLLNRGIPDLSKLVSVKNMVETAQQKYTDILKNIDHLEIHYESLVPGDCTTEYLDAIIQNRLLAFLDLDPCQLYTTYIKTGVNIPDVSLPNHSIL